MGQQAIDAFKSNKSFTNVGISLRDDRPSNEMCALAAERLGEVIADGDLFNESFGSHKRSPADLLGTHWGPKGMPGQ